MAGLGQLFFCDDRLAVPGQDARDVLQDAAAGDVGHPLDLEVAQQVEDRLDVDAGRRQQLFAQGALQSLGNGIEGELQVLEKDLAGQRVAVGMQAAGGDADQPVAAGDGRAVDDLGVVDHADGEAGQVVFALGVHPGHFRGFAADQGAAGLDAPLGNSLEDLHRLFR